MTLNAASLMAFNITQEVKKKYPGCEVEFYNMLSKDTEHVLQEGTYDFVIGPNWNLSPEFDYEMLYQDPYVLVVPTGMILRHMQNTRMKMSCHL